jgi:hypothetical protein
MEQYHDAPHTLHSQRDIDDPAPPSAGHDEESAEVVRERDQSFTEGVEAEVGQDEVGPGDPTLEKDDDGVPIEKDSDDSDDVPDGTISEVLDWVGDDSERAQRALDVERTGQNRSSLVSQLEAKV